MAEIEVAGPFRGNYLCKLPPDITVSVTSDEDFLFNYPLGQQLKEFKETGKDRYVFFKAKGKKEKQTGLKLAILAPGQKELSVNLNLTVNGKEQTLEAVIDKGKIVICLNIAFLFVELGFTRPTAAGL